MKTEPTPTAPVKATKVKASSGEAKNISSPEARAGTAATNPAPKLEDRVPSTESELVSKPAKALKDIPLPRPSPRKEAAVKEAVANPETESKKPAALPDDVGEDSDCLKSLASAGTTFVPVAQPSDKPECQIANPVRLVSVDVGGSKVKFIGEPVLGCKFAQKFVTWIEREAVPLTIAELNAPLQRINTGPGFVCRGRNGDSSAKMSEHATGNAADIESLQLGGGKSIHVKDALDTQAYGFNLLKLLRASACNYFTTVLGPGANAAHSEHFHFDLERRKVSGTYRICQ
jgi:hypothetical protein